MELTIIETNIDCINIDSSINHMNDKNKKTSHDSDIHKKTSHDSQYKKTSVNSDNISSSDSTISTNSSNIIRIDDVEDEINGYIDKINSDIGFYWWKRYIYSAFWANVSTPINLSIIILTALTTGENATKDLIGQHVSTILGIVVLFVSIFNTFFRPNEQLAQNQKIMEDWAVVGESFDEIYYDRVYTPKEKLGQLVKLEKLFKSMSSLKRINDNNYFIDLLYLIIRYTCIRKNIKWIHMNDASETVKKSRRFTLHDKEQRETQSIV